MDIYHYHPATGEHIGTGTAMADPLEDGRWLIPAHATDTEPPKVGENEVAVFDGEAWTAKPDYRGAVYWLEGERHIIHKIGEVVPNGGSTAEPEPEPDPEPPYVPQQVTRAQGKAALITAGLWPQVLNYVDGIEEPTEKALAVVALDDTTHWQRSSPFLNQCATALGITEEQMDQLFVQASEIQL